MSATIATPQLVTCAQCNRPGFIPKTDGNVPVHNENGTRCMGSNQPPRGAGSVTPSMTMTTGPDPAPVAKVEKRERPKGVPRLALDRPARVGDVVVAMHHGRAIWRGNVTAISASGTGVTIRNGGTEGVYNTNDVWVVKSSDAPRPVKSDAATKPATIAPTASASSAPGLVHVTCPRCKKELLAQADTLEIPKHKNPKGKDCKGAGETATPSPQAEIPVEPAPARARGTQSGLGALLPDASRTSQPDHGRSVLVDVALIDENSEMKRIPIDQATVDGLVESIPELGLIQPVTLVQRGERYELMDGRHRTLAYRALLDATKDNDAWGKIPAIVRRDLDEKSEKAVAGAANQVRRSTTPYEEAIYFKAQRDAGLSLSEIAKRAGIKSHNTISNRLRLLELPEDLAKRVDTDWFGSQHAELVIQALSKLGERAIKPIRETIRRSERETYLQTADRFKTSLAAELGNVELLYSEPTWRINNAAAAGKEWKARIDALPRIELGTGKNAQTYISDKAAVDKILADYDAHVNKQRALARASPATKTPAQREADKKAAEKERRERAINAEVEKLELEAQLAFTKKVQDFENYILAEILANYFINGYEGGSEEDEAALQQALGLDKKQFSKILYAKTSEIARMLQGKDRALLARIVVGTRLIERYGTSDDLQARVKFDNAKARAEAKKRVDAREAPAKPSLAGKKGGKK